MVWLVGLNNSGPRSQADPQRPSDPTEPEGGLRYGNWANREEQLNVVTIQYQKSINYKTYKAVLTFTELLVWYENESARNMGKDTKEDKNLPSPIDIEEFDCDVCGARFTTHSSLKGHRKSHPHMQSDRRHQCHLCSYSTDITTNLRRHLLTHSGERPHQCTHCHKAFKEKKSLSRHLLIHTGERPHSCTTCGKTFTQLGNMRTHERIHERVRLHRCPTCLKDFTNASHLKSHIVYKHTRDFSHTCFQCGKGFCSPSELNTHMDRQHSGNEVEKE